MLGRCLLVLLCGRCVAYVHASLRAYEMVTFLQKYARVFSERVFPPRRVVAPSIDAPVNVL